MSRILFGIHSVTEALRHSPGQVHEVWYDPGREKSLADPLALATQAKIALSRVERKFLDDTCERGKHQGIACRADDFQYTSLKEFFQQASGKSRVCVIADQVQDPQNLGAILRAMGAFGADLLVVGRHRGADVTPSVVRTSAGGAFVVPVAREPSLPNVLELLKKNGFWVYGLEADGETPLFEQNLSGDVVLVVGSEGRGLSRLIRERCDYVCRLPQGGSINSLNAAMALTCSLYEVARQRSGKLP